ncbi:MAG TPA: hypothetical protein VM686_41560, partial [Polyangiaceae bacterium]|nr:hypothetical protein [Polyangiaceae bacterium]
MRNIRTLGSLRLVALFALAGCAHESTPIAGLDASGGAGGSTPGGSAGASTTAGSSSGGSAGGWNAGGTNTAGSFAAGSSAGGSSGSSSAGTSGDNAGNAPNIPQAPVTTLEELAITTCEHTGSGTAYEVGPGQEYAEIGDVPIGDLGAGDTLRIHWREEPYREILLISAQGTPEDPVRICGVRGPGGERPVISGEGATTPQSIGTRVDWNGMGLVVFFRKTDDDWATYYPHDIILEGLDLQGAHAGAPFTDIEGQPDEFGEGSSCLGIYRGKNIVIRDNEISNCGFGIFTKSYDMDADQVANLLIEGNYIHGNNTEDTQYVHNLYVQAFGVVYQFNHLGSPLGANNIKDRSTGTVIRYNWIERSGAMLLDLVEAEEHKLTAVLDPNYRTALVYGNLMHQVYGSTPFHYGADHEELENEPYFRKGTLFFYANTVLIEDPADEANPWSRALFRVTTVDERVELFNNIFDYRGEPTIFELMTFNDPLSHLEQGGHLAGGKNYIRGDWQRHWKADLE